MSKLKYLLSLPTDDNDYQQEQAAAAKEAATRLGLDLQVVYANNDAIKQSDQILKAIQSPAGTRPDAILFEPLGATAFAVSSDHVEIGRIQGQQFAALLPHGGSVLYIQGPSENSAAKERTFGMQQLKPANIKINMLKGQWTEESAYKAVSSWMRLSTSGKQFLDLVGAQDDSMAIGARKAMQESADEALRGKWLGVPFTGCDGLIATGQQYVRNGLLAATVVVPPNTKLALEMLVAAMQQDKKPPELALTAPTSFPSVEELKRAAKDKKPRTS